METDTYSEYLEDIRPGTILRIEFVEEAGITPYRLAKDIGVPQSRIEGILDGKRSISPDTAIRLGRYFGTSAEFWLNLQAHYELAQVKHAKAEVYDRIRPRALAVV